MQLEKFVTLNGFEDVKDFNHHVARADLSTPTKLAKFNKWKYSDGTKSGLLALNLGTRPSTTVEEREDETECNRFIDEDFECFKNSYQGIDPKFSNAS